MKKFDYDLIAIGGGSGGLVAAKFARGLGKSVAIIEKNKLGGECTWTGCVPSKALIKVAQVAYQAKRLKQFGMQTSSELEIDTSLVMDHVRESIMSVYQTHTPEKIKEFGIDVLLGAPVFIDAHQVKLAGKIVSAKKFIIATGSSPFVPAIEGIHTIAYLTNQTIFELKALPKSILILGGGAIGAELACAFNRLGVRVTIIEMQERILTKEDVELSNMLSKILKKEGVIIGTGLRATKVRQESVGVCLTCTDTNSEIHEITAEKLLVAVGRRPNTQGIGLDQAGVEINKHGVVVDSYLRTTAKNIYACGDVVGPYQFSHMAFHQAVVATRNALIPLIRKKIDYTDRIWVTFTAPELARAGMTEQEARTKQKGRIYVYRKSYADLDRSIVDGTTHGLAKYICNDRGRLLGIHILGERAGDIIHEVQVCKSLGRPFTKLQSVMHAYPTYAEVNWHAAKEAYIEQWQHSFLLKMLQYFFKKN